MSSNSSIALSCVFALVLCGCEAQRVSKAPISYRQRPDSRQRAMPGKLNATPVDSPRQSPVRLASSRPTADLGGSVRSDLPRPAVAQSVVYRREDAKPKPSVAPRRPTTDVGLGQLVAERESEHSSSLAAMPPTDTQGGRPPVHGKDPGADKAKLKALYDSGFLTREEYLRAQNGE